ncbi:MAG: FtsB family cell division protein [bacterium]
MRTLGPGPGSTRPSAKPRGKDKKRQRFEYWVIWLLFLALFFIVLSIFGQNGLLQIGELKLVRKSLIKEVVALQEENDALSKEIQGLREDPFVIEKVAREELDLVRPNEVVYHLIPLSEESERGE